MAQTVTQPPLLDSTGQDIAAALDGISASLHRNGIKACYDESTALYAHAKDDIIYFDEVFYKATQAISVGDTIAVGTNLTASGITADTAVYVDKLPGAPGGGGSSKLPSSITVSSSSVSLSKQNPSTTVNLTVVGDGVLSASSNNACISTSLNGTTLTITASEGDEDLETATITVAIAEGQGYLATETYISVTSDWPLIPMKSFAVATDEEIAQMVAAADAGEIDLYEDCGWRVGQEHTTTLAAITASGTYDGVSWTVGEAQDQQQITFVLLHRGLYTLTNPVLDKQGQTRTTCSFVVGLKDCVYTRGYMNSTNTNTGSWRDSARRAWCNGGFRSAISSELRSVFKQFSIVTGDYNGQSAGGSNITTADYFALLAEKEVQGSKTHSTDNEANALTQLEYYQTAANKIKSSEGSAYYWWLRGVRYDDGTRFCSVTADGGAGIHSASNPRGVCPFGCL